MRRSDGITHQFFPDHTVIISVINLVQDEENTKKTTKTIMRNQAYIKYREMLQNGKCQYPNKLSMIDGQIK